MNMEDYCQILYGSETGNAEEISFKIRRLLMTQGITSNVKSMAEYDVKELPSENILIFIVSTTGDGDAPNNMTSFWKFLLRKSLAFDSLAKVKTAVFGLGDSSYEKYNASARKLNSRLRQLGSEELLPIGLGDDQAKYGYFTALDPWIINLYDALHKHITVNPIVVDTSILNHNADVSYEVHIEVDPISPVVTTCPQAYLSPRPGEDVIQGLVVENKRLTSQSWNQNVCHISIAHPSLKDKSSLQNNWYNTGDVAVIYPSNDNQLVHRLCSLYEPHLPCHSWLDITPSSSNCRAGRGRIGKAACTLETLFSKYLDIGGVPGRFFFEGLAQCCTGGNEEQRDKLLELSSAAGTDLYHDYCVRERRSYVDVLEDFRACLPWPLSRLLELIPPLRPRSYSIASSSRIHPLEIHLCVAVVERRTPLGKRRVGVCSGYLSRARPGDAVLLSVRRGCFAPPPRDVPLILVGPGTGVAPMRAVLQDRIEDLNQLPPSPPQSVLAIPAQAQTVLFFGCRRRNDDFLYADEFTKYTECMDESALTSSQSSSSVDSTPNASGKHMTQSSSRSSILVIPAFSQEQLQKNYVTHEIRRHQDMVWKMLQQGGHVFVAGSAKRMPSDVRAALRDAAVQAGRLDVTAADALLAAMARERRYTVEAWSS